MRDELFCPYRALLQLFNMQPYHDSDLVIKLSNTPFTEVLLCKRLSLVLKTLGLPTSSLTYHSLRRSGTSVAFNNNVSFDGIHSQGGWQSDAVWHYLFVNSAKAREVPHMFQQLESSVSCLGRLV